MEKLTEHELKVMAQLSAVQLLLVAIVRHDPALQSELRALLGLDLAQLAAQYAQLPMTPEQAHLLSEELQTAWESLLQRVLEPVGE